MHLYVNIFVFNFNFKFKYKCCQLFKYKGAVDLIFFQEAGMRQRGGSDLTDPCGGG